MDVYLFIETEPGLAGVVMEQLVASGAAHRAAVVTGTFDVFARIDGLEWHELGARILEGVHRIPGVRKTVSAAAVGLAQVAGPTIPPLPMPMKAVPGRGETVQALVFCTIGSGTAQAVAETVVRKKGVVIGATFVTGEHDLILQVSGRDFDHLTSRIVSEITTIPEITSTTTMLVVRATPHPGEGKGRKR
jgi:DNA-binding Lrp family transcriptional regulator